MGTGSFGGGGGGGGGGGSQLSGGYHSENGRLVPTTAPRDRVEKDVRKVFSKLPKEYLLQFFASPMVNEAYGRLFDLSFQVFVNHSWTNIAERYGITGKAGCLSDWGNAVIAETQTLDSNQKVRETVQVCLEDFLLRALDNDLDLFLHGSSDDIMSHLNQKVFNSTSGHFLGTLIWRVLERQSERLPENAETQLREVAQIIADRSIRQFEGKFRSDAANRIGYQQLFNVVSDNAEWFLRGLRQ